VDKFLYLGSEVNSEGKIDGEINKKIQNSSKFCQIKKGIILNETSQNSANKKIYKEYFEPVLTFNAETWALRKKNKSKIKAMNKEF
jgi:hypothetical protein